MSKKMLSLWSIVLATALVLGLVACGAASQESGAAQDSAAPAQEGAAEEPAAEAPSGEQRVFRLWYYEAEDSAQEPSWADALKDFEAMHPDVTVEFERKTFEQMQQTAQMVLNSSDVPDVMEVNKGNATAGL
jgi:raffinose/stachyose/melibiose transport system substrate-binding protein